MLYAFINFKVNDQFFHIQHIRRRKCCNISFEIRNVSSFFFLHYWDEPQTRKRCVHVKKKLNK